MIINGQALLKAAPIKHMLPTKERSHGVSHGLSEAGYDITLKQDVTFHGNMDSPYVMVTDMEGTSDKNGRFTLASAVEEFQMPDHLIGLVKDKSTWARQGLSVFNTVIECGWKGFLTLELVYHGNGILHLPAGCGIAQVIFEQIKEPSAYQGKYQNQADKPIEAIYEK